jgi:crotonobetainyl-CoA:carnitine CoA-transferase CaiB-like acyl-CoA transferase
MTKDVWQPLRGLKVVDFSMLLPGPFATLVLGDLGAEVIKVEPPGGDYSRAMKGRIFQGTNRNKKSIEIDIKSPGAKVIIEKLALYGDLAIEGFRPGVADRLGFGAAALQSLNPKLIYCSISGFGQFGPESNKAGHDLAYLAMAGTLAYKGQLRQPPRRGSLPVADIVGGAYAAIALLAALRERDITGKGPVLDMSLYESALYTTAARFGFDTDADSITHLFPGNDLFVCADGRQIAITIVEEKFWNNFVEATRDVVPEIGSPEFATEDSRLANAERLMQIFDTMFTSRPAQDWINLFAPHDVPASICITPIESLRTEQAIVRGIHVETPYGPVYPFPVIADGRRPPREQHQPPKLGNDGAQILSQLGFDHDQIAQFARDRTVRLPGAPE